MANQFYIIFNLWSFQTIQFGIKAGCICRIFHWILTGSKFQWGEGILEQIDLEIGKLRVVHKSTMTGSDAGENIEIKMSDEQF